MMTCREWGDDCWEGVHKAEIFEIDTDARDAEDNATVRAQRLAAQNVSNESKAEADA